MDKVDEQSQLSPIEAVSNEEICCPNCQLGKMYLEPDYKYESVYDVWTCNICEHSEIDYDLSDQV